jgi:hypothetical protein
VTFHTAEEVEQHAYSRHPMFKGEESVHLILLAFRERQLGIKKIADWAADGSCPNWQFFLLLLYIATHEPATEAESNFLVDLMQQVAEQPDDYGEPMKVWSERARYHRVHPDASRGFAKMGLDPYGKKFSVKGSRIKKTKR